MISCIGLYITVCGTVLYFWQSKSTSSIVGSLYLSVHKVSFCLRQKKEFCCDYISNENHQWIQQSTFHFKPTLFIRKDDRYYISIWIFLITPLIRSQFTHLPHVWPNQNSWMIFCLGTFIFLSKTLSVFIRICSIQVATQVPSLFKHSSCFNSCGCPQASDALISKRISNLCLSHPTYISWLVLHEPTCHKSYVNTSC